MLPVLLAYICALYDRPGAHSHLLQSRFHKQHNQPAEAIIIILIIIEITKSSISKVITIVRSLSQDECHQHWQHNHLGPKKSRKSSTGVHPKSDLTGDKFHFCIFWQLLVLDCNFWQQLVLDCNFSLIRYGISHTT